MIVRPPMGTQEYKLELNRSLITLTPCFSIILEEEVLPLNVASLVTHAIDKQLKALEWLSTKNNEWFIHWAKKLLTTRVMACTRQKKTIGLGVNDKPLCKAKFSFWHPLGKVSAPFTTRGPRTAQLPHSSQTYELSRELWSIYCFKFLIWSRKVSDRSTSTLSILEDSNMRR